VRLANLSDEPLYINRIRVGYLSLKDGYKADEIREEEDLGNIEEKFPLIIPAKTIVEGYIPGSIGDGTDISSIIFNSNHGSFLVGNIETMSPF
jgi:hypothetical protein